MAQSGSASGRQAAKFQKTPEELDITPHFLRTMTLESNDVVRFSLDEENDFGAAIGNPLLEALQDTWATVWAEYPEMTAGEVEELLRERTAETLRKLEEGN